MTPLLLNPLVTSLSPAVTQPLSKVQHHWPLCPFIFSLHLKHFLLNNIVMPDVRIPEREERRTPRQCNSKKGKFIADSSQGSCHIQCTGVGSETPEPKLLHKFIGWAHAIGSWFKWIGYKSAKQFHWSNTLKTFACSGLSRGFPPHSWLANSGQC